MERISMSDDLTRVKKLEFVNAQCKNELEFQKILNQTI